MRLRAFLIGCLLAVLILFVGGCGVVMLAASSLPSGELPEVDFRSAEISADRAAIVPELEAQLDGVERRFGAEHVGPRWQFDRCEEGFDDFTRTDRYAYSCRMQIAQLMPVGEPFVRNASRLGEALLEGDCPGGTDTDRALAEPYHSRPGQIDSSTGDCASGYTRPCSGDQALAHPRADRRRAPVGTGLPGRALRLDPRARALRVERDRPASRPRLGSAGRGVSGDRRRRRGLPLDPVGLPLAGGLGARHLPVLTALR